MSDDRKVFVIHGRNDPARQSMFAFLRALGLSPIEWSEALAATGSASPYIGQALDAAFQQAVAVVVLLTPDDIVQLGPEYASGPDDPELNLARQARPNVLFEAGMAFGSHPDRTILVEVGSLRPFSDVAGRHVVRLQNTANSRIDLANRLETAGCTVERRGTDWLQAGDFTPPIVGDAVPKGRRIPSKPRTGPRLDARYLARGSGSDRLSIINLTSDTILNIDTSDTFNALWIDGFPIEKLPGHKSVTLIVGRAMGAPRRIELNVSAETTDGESFTEELFVDMTG